MYQCDKDKRYDVTVLSGTCLKPYIFKNVQVEMVGDFFLLVKDEAGKQHVFTGKFTATMHEV